MSTIKKLTKNQFEIITDSKHIYVTRESKNNIVVDVFDSEIEDHDEAYLESFENNNIQDIKEELEDSFRINSSILDKLSFE